VSRVLHLPGRVTVRVPGKINLYLAVGELRDDGYHDLVTVFHAVDLCDELTVTNAPRHTVHTQGAVGVPAGAKNLAGAAARLLTRRTRAGGPVAIEITKQIPVAGGMAGGSADAAAALIGCAALWGLELSRDQMSEIGAELGSDVPFALAGGTAVGTGRGERLSPVLARTPLTSGDPKAVGAALGNDLQAAAISLQPGLRRTLRAGIAAGALGGVVSGSGPTVALLCADQAAAGEVAAELAGSGTCRAVRVAAGPAPGAKLIS